MLEFENDLQNCKDVFLIKADMEHLTALYLPVRFTFIIYVHSLSLIDFLLSTIGRIADRTFVLLEGCVQITVFNSCLNR